MDDRATERVQELAALRAHDPGDEPQFWLTDTGDYHLPDPQRLAEPPPEAVAELVAGPT